MKKAICIVTATIIICFVIFALFVYWAWQAGIVYVPPAIEKMSTCDDAPYPEDQNLVLILDNQTGRELSSSLVMDDRLVVSSSIIRDQHFGSASLSIDVAPGEHRISVYTCGFETSGSWSFTIKPNERLFVVVMIRRNKGDTDITYTFHTADKPPVIM